MKDKTIATLNVNDADFRLDIRYAPKNKWWVYLINRFTCEEILIDDYKGGSKPKSVGEYKEYAEKKLMFLKPGAGLYTLSIQ